MYFFFYYLKVLNKFNKLRNTDNLFKKKNLFFFNVKKFLKI